MSSGSKSMSTENVILQGTAGEVFGAFLKLGLTSFGGPIAHLGYFRDELVIRRKWIDEAGYADLVALCHPVITTKKGENPPRPPNPQI